MKEAGVQTPPEATLPFMNYDQLRAGDPQTWTDQIRTRAPLLNSYAFGLGARLGLAHEAEDTIDEAYVRFFVKILEDKIPNRTNRLWDLAYLKTIVRTIFLDILKSSGHRQVDLVEDPDEFVRPAQGPEEILLGEANYSELVEQMNRLPSACRKAIRLHDEGLDNQEAARLLGITNTGFSSALCRAKGILRGTIKLSRRTEA